MPQTEHRVEREVTLPAEREEVWHALTDADLLSEWLGDDVEMDAAEGGEVRSGSNEGGSWRGEVERVDEGERLAWRWTGPDRVESRVELVLEDAVGGTRLLVVERAVAPGPLASAGAWSDRLLMLELLWLPSPRAPAPSGALRPVVALAG